MHHALRTFVEDVVQIFPHFIYEEAMIASVLLSTFAA